MFIIERIPKSLFETINEGKNKRSFFDTTIQILQPPSLYFLQWFNLNTNLPNISFSKFAPLFPSHFLWFCSSAKSKQHHQQLPNRSTGTLAGEVGCVISLMHHLRSRNTQVYAKSENCKQRLNFSKSNHVDGRNSKPNHVGDKRNWKITDFASIQAFHCYWQAIWRNYQQWWAWQSFCSFFIERSVSRSDKR